MHNILCEHLGIKSFRHRVYGASPISDIDLNIDKLIVVHRVSTAYTYCYLSRFCSPYTV